MISEEKSCQIEPLFLPPVNRSIEKGKHHHQLLICCCQVPPSQPHNPSPRTRRYQVTAIIGCNLPWMRVELSRRASERWNPGSSGPSRPQTSANLHQLTSPLHCCVMIGPTWTVYICLLIVLPCYTMHHVHFNQILIGSL